MKFAWLNKQGVISDTGFIVQCVSRFTIEYREGKKCISIDVESDYAPDHEPIEIIKRSSFDRWDDGAAILPTKQIEIIKNFEKAMKFQGIAVIVDDSI